MDTGEILLTRHSEKPSDPLDPDLSPTGYDCAEELPAFIQTTFGYPDFLFASAISKHSRRPWETVQPISKASGVPVDTSFADQDYEALARELFAKPRYQASESLSAGIMGIFRPSRTPSARSMGLIPTRGIPRSTTSFSN